MNEEVQVLKDIYFLLYTFIAVYLLNISVRVLNGLFWIKRSLTERQNESFRFEAQNLYEKGLIPELIDLCEKRLKIRPNHATALFYSMLAYFNKGEYSKAKEYIEKLKLVDPGSEEGYAKPYSEIIREKIREMFENTMS